MYYIKDKHTYTFNIQKSEFIGICLPINNVLDVKEELDKIKKDYPKANHYCYAYILDNYIKFSDDGEPNQTAGKPILSVLQNNNMNGILMVVVRYFGGIKLGASNLLRAYVNTTTDCLKSATLYEKRILNQASIEVDYKYSDILFNYLEKNEYLIKSREFLETIKVVVLKENIAIEEIKNYFNGNIEITLLEDEDTFKKV